MSEKFQFLFNIGSPLSTQSLGQVSAEEVERVIFSVKSYAVDLDEIPLSFIKQMLPIIMPIFLFIYLIASYSCLTFSQFPKIWKVGKVVPIAKVSLPKTTDDYRPITILPDVSKALEKLKKNQIVDFLAQKNLLCKYQSGFREAHSTTKTVPQIVDDLSMAIESRQLSVLAMLNFSKAVGLVNHNLLLKKIENSVNIVKSFISDRSQVVFSNGQFSQEALVSTGVP
jgi:Reverse transcriptase (RNA-dependent DNA polymerase)